MFEKIQVTQLNDHVYLLDDDHSATGYLVVGEEKAMMIDTMVAGEDLGAVVRSITELPVVVVNTHGHCDHIYGNIYFQEAYLHPADLPVAQEHMQFPEFVKACAERKLSMPEFLPVRGGECFDLGGLHIEVTELPGHTPGGLLLLLKEDRILFTGDGINRHLWMQLEESLPIPEFVKNLEAVMYLKNEADYICHGHARGFEDISLMDELLAGARDLAQGNTAADESYKWFGGVGKQHAFAKDSVICYKD